MGLVTPTSRATPPQRGRCHRPLTHRITWLVMPSERLNPRLLRVYAGRWTRGGQRFVYIHVWDATRPHRMQTKRYAEMRTSARGDNRPSAAVDGLVPSFLLPELSFLSEMEEEGVVTRWSA